jgi:hypothetical protein
MRLCPRIEHECTTSHEVAVATLYARGGCISLGFSRLETETIHVQRGLERNRNRQWPGEYTKNVFVELDWSLKERTIRR